MFSTSLISLSLLSLPFLAQAIAYPQASTTHDVLMPSATFDIKTPNGQVSSTSNGMAIGVIVAIAVVIICSMCGCCGMIWWFCARHRKSMRRIRAQNEMAPLVAPEQPTPTSGGHGNIITPFGRYPQGEIDQGTESSRHFDPKMMPQTPSTASATPMNALPPSPQPVYEMPANPTPLAELKG